MGAITTRRRAPSYLQDRDQTRRHSPDYWLLILTIALAAVGIVVVFSISPALEVEKHVDGNQYVFRQIIAVLLGLVLFFVAAAVPLNRWRNLYKPLLVLAAFMTVVALILPVNADYPAHRWIRISGFSFQSVELVKFAGILWLASFLSWRLQNGLVANLSKTAKPLLAVSEKNKAVPLSQILRAEPTGNDWTR